MFAESLMLEKAFAVKACHILLKKSGNRSCLINVIIEATKHQANQLGEITNSNSVITKERKDAKKTRHEWF